MTEIDAIKNINTYIYSELESIPKQLLESLKLACFTLREVQQYRAIGTPEECRAAVEKQKAKKPKTDDRYVMYICPWCNDFVKVSHNYCQNCGQKLDLGE